MALSPGHPLNGERVLRIPPSYTTEPNKYQILNKTSQMATWNVRSLLQTGKLANAVKEMKRMNIDILGLSEVRWPSAGTLTSEGIQMYYSGGTDNKNRNGVAIMISEKIAASVVNFLLLSDRVIMVVLETTYRRMNVLQAYAPTNDK